MAQSKHTPGPLKASLAVVCNAPSVYVITNGKWGAPNLAQVYSEGDATLFAAAPEMLEELKRIQTELLEHENGGAELGSRLYRVIAKAEGRK